MPLSPSMNVIRLLHEAVFMKAGSYAINPKSSSETLIFRRSIARITPSSIGISYCLPVRLSVTVNVFALILPPLNVTQDGLEPRPSSMQALFDTQPEHSGH